MKLTSRFSHIFVLLLLTLTLLSASALAATAPTGAVNRPSAPTVQARISATRKFNLAKIPVATPLFTETNNTYSVADDRHTLHSVRFTLPYPNRYMVHIAAPLTRVIRKAPIRRKGNLQG